MFALTMIFMMLGIAFTLFGYYIFVQKKYSLINGFDEAYRSGRKNEQYAQWVELIELILGVTFLLLSVVLLLLS